MLWKLSNTDSYTQTDKQPGTLLSLHFNLKYLRIELMFIMRCNLKTLIIEKLIYVSKTIKI